MSRFRSLAAGGATALTLVAGNAAAEPRDHSALEEILVTARSIEDTLPLELARYGHGVATVSADRIAAAGYVDVSSALQFEAPGLFVSPGSGPYDYVDVSLQGSRTGDVLWLIDGVRINNRIYNDTSPDTLPGNMVERIEVLKGGESLFYGTQGVAGAINIVTRSFSDYTYTRSRDDGSSLHGFGRRNIGNYTTVNLAGRVFLDHARHHRIGASIESVFDEAYVTRLTSVQRHDGTGAMLVQRLGMPRTFKLTYSYDFE